VFEPFLIVVFESPNCPQCENMDLKILQSLLARVQICKRCWKICRTCRTFLKDVGQFNSSVKTNKGLRNNHNKEVMGHPGNDFLH